VKFGRHMSQQTAWIAQMQRYLQPGDKAHSLRHKSTMEVLQAAVGRAVLIASQQLVPLYSDH
jgi:hypothetical protein